MFSRAEEAVVKEGKILSAIHIHELLVPRKATWKVCAGTIIIVALFLILAWSVSLCSL